MSTQTRQVISLSDLFFNQVIATAFTCVGVDISQTSFIEVSIRVPFMLGLCITSFLLVITRYYVPPSAHGSTLSKAKAALQQQHS